MLKEFKHSSDLKQGNNVYVRFNIQFELCQKAGKENYFTC